jgi:hypothetical protein
MRIGAGDLTAATREVAAQRHNLAAVLTPFNGRDAALAVLSTLQHQPDAPERQRSMCG